MNFLHTRRNGYVIPRPEGIEAAEGVFRMFGTVSHAEILARLSLRINSGTPGTYLTDQDRKDLVNAKYLANLEDSCKKSLTIKGQVAVCMVVAEEFGQDLDFWLTEPFEELDVLDMIHKLAKQNEIELG